MALVRYGIPLALVITGVVVLFVADDSVAPEAWAGFTGAGIAVLLLNILFRIGVKGDVERDREDEARAYFDRYGRWPDEESSEQPARPAPPPHRPPPETKRRAARPPRRP
jgi:hypothetical protein